MNGYEERALAIGVETGAGDDAIVNSGSIVTEIALNGADPVAGVGILAGAGNDEVILTDGSLIDGSIDLGENEDILKFIGNVQVTGEVTGNGGTVYHPTERGSIDYKPFRCGGRDRAE
ncbi:MAG: hypothetical protein U9R17_00325 [Thermodesulfobacteriota bacterium]|nr:hypothetical protein [Thermodesulfobacteriota bacterium]